MREAQRGRGLVERGLVDVPLSHNCILVPTSLGNRLLQRRLGSLVGGRAPPGGLLLSGPIYVSLGRIDCESGRRL